MDLIKVKFIHDWGTFDLLVQVVPRIGERLMLPNGSLYVVRDVTHIMNGRTLPQIRVNLNTVHLQ